MKQFYTNSLEKWKHTVKVTATAFSVLLGLNACRNSGAETEYRTFYSPDGRYKIVVYRVPETSATMPGQAGDAPGSVCLYETANGKLLNEKRVEMVQVIDQISWSATNVDIKLFADWKLP